ncbi:MAG: hypothetical protein IKG26_12075 [Bacillus sp. (in: Bacteria)]|nr:hypothetical protein [Bacillus sp. (in: firmicutes)]
MYMTIGRIFDLSVGKYPNKEALVEPEKNIRWTYKQWDEQINKTAHALLEEGGCSESGQLLFYLVSFCR